ncbi:hypothetical protein LMJ53_07095 [Rheinheimera sp. UJ51]|uniref:hypothetical protein n=1 Tax=Rheinheimera sp. UJ51 TaxID=2892446 RepID=UPI001E57041A|nr:hypothetical protein [Rheinheimera sp. UJ51]MCC5451498.1 hypothetical protein [Rheinheimera sp. UJ51]
MNVTKAEKSVFKYGIFRRISSKANRMTITLEDIQNKFSEEVKYVDDSAQILLKGHLVVEDLMNQALEAFVLHGEYIEDAKLQFHQKLELCKAISVGDNNNNMWNLIKKINVLRNALSHSLDPGRREKAVKSLASIYDQEFDPKTRVIDGLSEEAALCMASIMGSLGYLHSFLSETQRFESLVKTMDKIMNKGQG